MFSQYNDLVNRYFKFPDVVMQYFYFVLITCNILAIHTFYYNFFISCINFIIS